MKQTLLILNESDIQICNVSPIPGEIQMFENNLINEKISR